MAQTPQSARALAARTVAEVLCDGRSLTAALEGLLPTAERSLVRELVYGTLRWFIRLEALVGRLLQKPLRARDQDVQALLLIGAYQLLYMRIPDYAAVGATAEAARELEKVWAVGLVNGVLRELQRASAALQAEADKSPSVALAHPAWLLGRLQQAYPADWQRIATANNARAPMALRVNVRRASRDDYLQRLAAAGLSARPTPHVPSGVLLEEAEDVAQLPGFRRGDVSVQDAAAQLAAGLLDLSPGQRLLDLCCAPGGKLAHACEAEPALGDVVGVDIQSARLARTRETLARLGLDAQLAAGDAAAPHTWWDGRLFDRILVDAPCSATGVIRRHPDIKLLRRESDIAALAALQGRILNAAWGMLAPGGRLVYVTCSVLPEENEFVMAHFVAGREDVSAVAFTADWGRSMGVGRQILPGEDDMDGFYYACLEKRPEAAPA